MAERANISGLPPILRESSEHQFRNRIFAHNRSRQLLSGGSARSAAGRLESQDTGGLRQAFAVHDLITTGDLAQEGVLEALVAMAEEEEAALRDGLPERRAAPVTWGSTPVAGAPPPARSLSDRFSADDALGWLGPDRRVQRGVNCESPRILTRDATYIQPLPEGSDDPVSPEVLERYSNYAAEYASGEADN